MEQATDSSAVTESTVNLTEDDSEGSNNGHREQLCELLHSHKAQYAIIALVVIDMIIVIAELLLDLRAIEVHHDNPAPHVLHYISIAILSIFMIELVTITPNKKRNFLLLFTLFYNSFNTGKRENIQLGLGRKRLRLLHEHIQVISSFSGEEGAVDGISLIVLLRLWRVTRIVNGIVLSVKMQAERKIQVLEKENTELKEEIEQLKTKCVQFEAELKTLRGDATPAT
ncbi:voltage-gated hydrogen channel 1-like [Orbicella faveolata]|uniref:voltage-gated hydrogen channel 1-like n=1 Tax=Orbicella faveolata TaxID=48498 RepID=UPI0009E327D7|nr:voltage-gated hydrogen channel 1-like [Orbicella faveolata]